jgi:hypothetical protein
MEIDEKKVAKPPVVFRWPRGVRKKNGSVSQEIPNQANRYQCTPSETVGE